MASQIQSDLSAKLGAKLDPRFSLLVQTTLDMTTSTLGTMTQLQFSPGRLYLRREGPKPDAEIAAVIGLTSAAFKGTLAMSFPLATYLQTMSKMLGSQFTQVTREIRDGGAEILNMVLGHTKIALNKGGFAIEMALPRMLEGPEVKDKLDELCRANPNAIVVPLKSSLGAMYLELI